MNNDNLLKQEKIITKILIMECVTAIPSIVIAVSSNSLVLLLDIVDYALSMSLHTMAIVILRKSRESHKGVYDYGLGKFESLLSLAIAGALLMGLLLLLGMAAHRFFAPVEVKPLFAYLGIATKAFFFGMNTYFAISGYKLCKADSAPIMEAQWRSSATYAIVDIITIISLSLGLIFSHHPWSRLVDPAFLLVLAALSGTSLVRLIKTSMLDLMDKTLEEKLQFKILKHVCAAESGYERFYDIHSRTSGPRIFIEIGLGFDPAKTVGEVLAVTDRIKNGVEGEIPNSTVNVIINGASRNT